MEAVLAGTNMEFHSFMDQGTVVGFAYLHDGRAGRQAISSVTLYRRSGQRQIVGWCSRDIGLPVMHAASLRVTHQIPEALLDDAEIGVMLTELLCAWALCVATGEPLVEDPEPAASDQQVMDEFNELFPEFAEAISNSVMHGGSRTGHPMTLPPALVDLGLEMGLMTRSGMGLRPTENMLTIEQGRDCCALEANVRLQALMKRSGQASLWPMANLDLAAAAQALQSVARLQPSTVWYYGDCGNPARTYRLQAAAAYPLLAALLAETPEMTTAIDSCAPLGPTLTELTGLTAAKLKRLAKIHLKDGSSGADHGNGRGMDPAARQESDLSKLLGICQKLDSGWVPDNADTWCLLRDLHACLIEPLAIRYEQDPVRLLMPAKGRWQNYAGKLAERIDVEADHFDGRAMQIIGDEIVSLVDDFLYSVLFPQLLQPALLRGDALPYPAAEMLIEAGQAGFEMLSRAGNDPIGALIRLLKRWQNRMQSLYALEQQSRQIRDLHDEKRIRTSKRWPALAGDFTTSAGYAIRCLNTISGLKEESRRLKHCVGNLYVTPARQGIAHLFSIQNAEGDCSYSTFEVSRPHSNVPDQAILEISVVQHKASANRKPGIKLRTALEEWLAAVRSGLIDLNLHEVIDWYEKARTVRSVPSNHESSRISPKAAWSSILSTSWSDQEINALIREEWYCHILPKQCPSPDQLLADKRVLALGI